MSEESAPLRATRAAIFAAMCVALGAVGHSYMSGTDIPLVGLLSAFAVTGGLACLAAGRRRGPVGITAAVLAVQGVLHLVFSGSRAAVHVAAAPAAAEGHHHHMPAAGIPGAGDPADVAGMAHAAGTADAAGVADAARTADVAGMPDGAGMADVAGMPDPAGMADAAGTADLAGMADMAWMAADGGVGMIAAHLLAGLLCAAWLARGEAAVFRLARVLGAAALHAARPLARALALVRARAAAVPAPPAFPAPCERPRRLRGAVHAHAVVRRGPPGSGPVPRFTAPGRPARA
ncbi:hypothetical protein [Streptomyces sp. NBC_01233]|uniref:hypothetical protein n=1 Tax=Streptomyces sp. NBC_01233 TaxID=2903787 RepID=UPI002E0E2663|nr:hypothetical protein OG332_13005 [Streptomyces sp. NBC_01233]